MNGEKVMVTGAAGMVGSHLVEELLERGYEVHGLDIVPLDKANNLRECRDHPNLHYTVGDIRDLTVIENYFQSDATTLYHLASVVGVRYYMEDPLSLIDIAIIGTRKFIELCDKHKVRILFTSTSEVYGRNPSVPWKEDDERVLGATSVDRWSYSSSKAVVEHMLFGIHHKSGLPMSIVRFFNVYGPRQNPIYVVSQSVYRALRNEPSEIYDGGQQTRCFTYIGDVIDGVIRAATDDAAIGEVFNIGNPVEVEIGHVVKTCVAEAGTNTAINDVDTTEKYGKVYEDIIRRVPDVSKAERLLGWKAHTSVEQGIANTIAWARANDWYLQ